MLDENDIFPKTDGFELNFLCSDHPADDAAITLQAND